MLAVAWLLVPVAASADSYFVSPQSTRDGMIVSLTKDSGVVEPATTDNAQSAVGVLDGQAIDLDAQAGQSNVVTTGTAQTIVSTLTGNITVGDRIAPSPLVGIGAKAASSGWVVGIAQGSLDASNKNATKTTITDQAGKKQTVYVATIPVQIKVTYYVAPQKAATSRSFWQSVGKAVQSAANALAGGRHVSQHAVILGSALILAGLIIAGIMVNAAIRSGILAIGRQPLARRSINLSMLRSVLIALGILLLSFIGAGLVVRVF